MNKFTELLNGLTWLNEKIGKIIIYLVWIGMVVIAWEVISRYAFNAPTVWASGYTQRIFAVYFIMIGAYALIHNGHVRVDIFINQNKFRRFHALNMINMLALSAWMLAITYESWFYFIDAWDFNETDDSALGHAMWPINLSLLIGTVLMLVQGVVFFLQSLLAFIGNYPVPVLEDEL